MSVTGTEADVKDFISKILVEEGKTESMFAREITSIFKSLIPIPEELYEVTSPVREEQAELAEQMLQKYGYSNWYDWQYDNWGVKWGDCHTFKEEEEHELPTGKWEVVYIYDLPWGDGEGGHQNISKLFPNLRFGFDFDEEAGFFQGCQVMKGGEILFSEFFDPAAQYDEMRKDYPSDITDEQIEELNEKHNEWCNEQMSIVCMEADKIGL